MENKISKIKGTLGFSKASKWGKLLRILFYGIIVGLYGLLSLFLRNGNLPVSQFILNFTVLFFLGAYMALIISEKCIDRVYAILPSPLQRVAKTMRLWMYMLLCWILFIPVRISLSLLGLEVGPLVDMIWVYALYVILIFPSVYSLVICVPSSQYLASSQAKEKAKKEVANALTILTPALGFPLIILIFLVLSIININVEPYWVNYLVILGIYIALFLFVIDLPYSISLEEKKKREIEKLQEERKQLLGKLKKLGTKKAEDLWNKIYLESRIERIDREKEGIKSKPNHPYKIIVSLLSLILVIFTALLIDIVKQLITIV